MGENMSEGMSEQTADFIERMKSGATTAQATKPDPPEPLRNWPDKITLAELWERTNGKIDRALELVKDLWLERGGGAFWISSSGTGKSVTSLQLAYAWAVGRDYFGMTPARPLRVAIVQTEDSVNEVTLTQAGMRAGYMAANGGNWTAEDVAKAEGRITMMNAGGLTGDGFCSWLREKLTTAADIGERVDVLIVNPFTSFFNGELNSQREIDEFLKGGIDPIIKDPAIGCGVIFFHHTAKPAGGGGANKAGYTDREGYLEYIGSGSSAITNWARAVMVFLKDDKTEGRFKFHATKRGGLLDLTDDDGNRTKTLTLRHAREGELVPGQRLPFWFRVTAAEVAEDDAKRSEGEAQRMETNARQVADWIINGDAKYGNVKHVAIAGSIDEKCRQLFKTGKRGGGEIAKSVAKAVKEGYANYGLDFVGIRYGKSTFKFYGTAEAIGQLQSDRPWELKTTEPEEE